MTRLTPHRVTRLLEKWSEAARDFTHEMMSEAHTSDKSYALHWIQSHLTHYSASDVVREAGLNIAHGGTSEGRHHILRTNEHTLLVTPGTGYTSGIHQLFWAWFYADKITVSCSTNDEWTKRFVEHLQKWDDPERVRVVDRYTVGDLDQYTGLVVNGSSETVSYYQSKWDPNKPSIYYGPKMSACVLDTKWLSVRDYKEIVRDITKYDGLGCLNTSVIFAQKKIAALVARELDQLLSADVPGTPAGAMAVLSFRSELGVEGRVAYLPKYEGQMGKGYGTVVVVPFGSMEEFVSQAKPYEKLWSSVTLHSKRREEWYDSLLEVGFSRIAVPGSAQNPNVNWQHDGMNNMLPMMKVASIED